jgi:hypothetical protein
MTDLVLSKFTTNNANYIQVYVSMLRRCIQKFPERPPATRTANSTALCYRYFVSQSSEFCRHNTLCCFSTSNTKSKRIFHYRFSPETFGYTLVQMRISPPHKYRYILLDIPAIFFKKNTFHNALQSVRK